MIKKLEESGSAGLADPFSSSFSLDERILTGITCLLYDKIFLRKQNYLCISAQFLLFSKKLLHIPDHYAKISLSDKQVSAV